jgi:hypothetical protein
MRISQRAMAYVGVAGVLTVCLLAIGYATWYLCSDPEDDWHLSPQILREELFHGGGGKGPY